MGKDPEKSQQNVKWRPLQGEGARWKELFPPSKYMFTLYYWVFIIVCMYCLYTSLKNEKKKRKTQTYTQTQTQRGTCSKSHESGSSFDYRASIWAPLGTEAWLWRGKPVASPSAPGTGHKAEGTDVPGATLHALLGSGCCCSSVDLMKPLSRTGECFSFSHFHIIFGYGARVIVSIFFFLIKCFLMTTKNEVSSRFVVPNKGVILPLWGHLPMSGDPFGCHRWGERVLLASSGQRPGMKFDPCPAEPRAAPTAKDYPSQTVSSAEAEKPGCRPHSF